MGMENSYHLEVIEDCMHEALAESEFRPTTELQDRHWTPFILQVKCLKFQIHHNGSIEKRFVFRVPVDGVIYQEPTLEKAFRTYLRGVVKETSCKFGL